jgi:hypothetical protein
MLTSERREIEVPAYYVTPLGYVLCVTCVHDGRDRSKLHRVEGKADQGVCDLCHGDMAKSIEIVTGTAAIEHVTCKVF